jgi:Aromatic-ring-opening dioxygenase LigAB, LigA subunit
MASNFTNLLIKLSDPQQFQLFQQDPNAYLDKAGIAPTEKNLILHKDMQGMRSTLHADPDLKAALGLAPNQNLPPILPAFIRVV